MVHPDPALEKRVDGMIAKIAAAQEKDGYLYTARTIDPAHLPVDWMGKERWSNLYMSHELYDLGHLTRSRHGLLQGHGQESSPQGRPEERPTGLPTPYYHDLEYRQRNDALNLLNMERTGWIPGAAVGQNLGSPF